MLKHVFLSLTAGTLLVACSQEPETTAEAPAEASEQPAIESTPTTSSEDTVEQLAQNPEALREAMSDPEQREALIEAMRERREARRAERGAEGGDVDREAMREQMRERRAQMMAERGADGADPREQMRERMLERSRWWADEDLQASIGLSEAQSEALTAAQLQLEDQRQAARQTLGQNQRALMDAIRAADRTQIMNLVEQRSMNQQALQDLELEWWRMVLDELSDDQLATLAEENPQVLLRRGGR